jgi:hypothetical protein
MSRLNPIPVLCLGRPPFPKAGRSRDRGEQRYCGAAEAVFFVVGEEVLAFVDELANGCGGDVVSASYA